MSNLNIEASYKNQIESIWQDERFQWIPFIDRGYAVQKDIPFGSILFVGLNPSFSEKNTKRIDSFFYSNHEQEEVLQYFKKFPDISEKTEIEWSHLDLIYLRQTDQKIVKAIFNDRIGNEFLQKQLDLSKSIIELSKPKIIVVSNAFARDLFIRHCNIQTLFDNMLGTHKIINNKYLEGTPVFFTSMLTGKRALDLGSYDRLIWHIRYVLKKISM